MFAGILGSTSLSLAYFGCGKHNTLAWQNAGWLASKKIDALASIGRMLRTDAASKVWMLKTDSCPLPSGERIQATTV